MNPSDSIYVAGHTGMVGSATVRRLHAAGFQNVITRSHRELDLCDAAAVDQFFATEKPAVVVHAGARVGGIEANRTDLAGFMHDNLAMALNVIHSAYCHGTARLLYLGSSCIYPRNCPQPMAEAALLTGPLEPTNEGYALAKIAGLKMCQFYRREYGVVFHSAMPTNLYGPGDNYHRSHSHVLPALIRRLLEAKEAGLSEVTIWGSGTPLREFLFVDDLADAILHLLSLTNPPDWVNVGVGKEISILALAEIIRDTLQLDARIVCDPTKPDGTPRKLLDVSLLHRSGWCAKTRLRDGIAATIEAFRKDRATGTLRT